MNLPQGPEATNPITYHKYFSKTCKFLGMYFFAGRSGAKSIHTQLSAKYLGKALVVWEGSGESVWGLGSVKGLSG